MARARAAAWSSCNRVADDQWHDSWQAHRERIEFIQTASSVSTHAFSSALAASGHPHRIHKGKTNSNGSTLKTAARLKSPAAKSRQKQIDRDNLILIKKIIAIDNAKTSALPGTGITKKKRANSLSGRSTKAAVCATARSYDKNTIVVPEPTHSGHACKQPLPEVPQTAASHALYTRNSATMKNNFSEYNTPTMLHASNSSSATARVRSRAQAKIINENKKILRRILTARSTVSRSDWRQHEEQHNKILTIMSRHNSTSKLPQQKPHQQRILGISRSQGSLHRESSEDAELLSRNDSDSLIRVDSTSHLAQQQQQQQRPRPVSAATGRPRSSSSTACPLPLHTARTSEESVVTRMRRMTIESQCDDEM